MSPSERWQELEAGALSGDRQRVAELVAEVFVLRQTVDKVVEAYQYGTKEQEEAALFRLRNIWTGAKP